MIEARYNNLWLENIFFVEVRQQTDEDVIGEVEIGTEQSNALRDHTWTYLGELDECLKTKSQSLNVESERNHKS